MGKLESVLDVQEQVLGLLIVYERVTGKGKSVGRIGKSTVRVCSIAR